MEDISVLVERLCAPDNRLACAAMRELAAQSAQSAAVYPYFSQFHALLSSSSSYIRNRALTLFAANARWDMQNLLPGMLADYLVHITDPKPITARQCVQGLPAIAAARPDLVPQILSALKQADLSGYADSMRPLLIRDIDSAVQAMGSV